MSTVSSGQSTALRTPARTIPIVVVPGIMGTRLSDPVTHDLVWNPLGAPAGRSPGSAFGSSATGLAARLQNLARPLVGDEWHTAGYVDAARATDIRHFYELVSDSYDQLCFGLHQVVNALFKATEKNKALAASVWACGYDWRQSNILSAVTLAARVAEARKACNDEKVILVAHSMGGLVCRLFCKLFGGEAAVRALFLVASPSLGAVLPYAYLKRGLVLSDGNMMGIRLAYLHELLQSESREFCRSQPSLWQLMPSPQFCRLRPDWLGFDRADTGYPWTQTPGGTNLQQKLNDASDPYAVFGDMYVGFMERAATRSLYQTFISGHAGQYRALSVGTTAYMPPNTYVLHCDNLDTPTTGNLSSYGGVVTHNGVNEYVPSIDTAKTLGVAALGPITGPAALATFGVPRIEAPLELQTGGGDESVPAWSANPADVSNPIHVDAIPGVNHAALPNDGTVLALITGYINNLDFTT